MSAGDESARVAWGPCLWLLSHLQTWEMMAPFSWDYFQINYEYTSMSMCISGYKIMTVMIDINIVETSDCREGIGGPAKGEAWRCTWAPEGEAGNARR